MNWIVVGIVRASTRDVTIEHICTIDLRRRQRPDAAASSASSSGGSRAGPLFAAACAPAKPTSSKRFATGNLNDDLEKVTAACGKRLRRL